MTNRLQWTSLVGLLHAGLQYGADMWPPYNPDVEDAFSDWWSRLWDARTGTTDYTVIRSWDGTVVRIDVNP